MMEILEINVGGFLPNFWGGGVLLGHQKADLVPD